MAKTGEELDNPVTGQRLIFRRTTAETDGELLEVESVWTKRGSGERLVHLHPKQDEHFEVLEGELEAQIGGERRTLRKGDSFDVPAGTPHAMWNEGPGEARALWRTTPALETERFFETMWKLAADGKVGRAGAPPALHSALILRHFRNEFRLVRPQLAVQVVAFGLLAQVARLRGYSPTYP